MIKPSSMNRNDFYEVIKTDSQNFQASKFFGTKSASDRPVVVKPQRNFRHEAELLIVDHFNGVDNNFGFTKPIGGKSL